MTPCRFNHAGQVLGGEVRLRAAQKKERRYWVAEKKEERRFVIAVLSMTDSIDQFYSCQLHDLRKDLRTYVNIIPESATSLAVHGNQHHLLTVNHWHEVSQ